MADFGVLEIASMVGTGMQVLGKIQGASATRAAGARQQQVADMQAAQLRQDAVQQEAASQRKSMDETRHASLIASRAIAAAGASGGGVTDPSVVNLIADIQGEGAYRSGVQIYQGEENARQLRNSAYAKTVEGQTVASGANQRASALEMGAFGSAISGAGTIYNRFGMKKAAAAGSPEDFGEYL